MAPKPPSKAASKFSGNKARSSSTPSRSSKSKVPRPAPKQQKSKPGQQTSTTPKKKKPRTYTDKQLNLPTVNGIIPAGVTRSSGKKKGKVFIDDSDEMMTILNLVRAEKDGQIESKMIKMRQLEEIREGRKKEMEKREQVKGEKLEELKNAVKKKRGKKAVDEKEVLEEKRQEKAKGKSGKKRVSFA